MSERRISARPVTADEQWRDDSALLDVFLKNATEDSELSGLIEQMSPSLTPLSRVDRDALLQTALSISQQGEEAGFDKLTIAGARVYVERYGDPGYTHEDDPQDDL